MKYSRNILALAAALACADRAMTNDVAIKYRMDAGMPGDITRTHTVEVEAVQIDETTSIPLFYGAALTDEHGTNNKIRGLGTGDAALTSLYGFLVRPFPTQQTSGGMTSTLGSAVPPVGGIQDCLREGSMIVKVNATTTITKKGPVYVWVAVNSGAHVQGQLESAAAGGSTAGPLTNVWFNGPPDANGNVEIQVVKIN